MATTTNNGWETPDDTDLVKDGALAIRTLGNNIDTSTGKGLIAWQTWAPAFVGSWAAGNGTWSAYYCQIGKTVHFYVQFTLGSTTTKSGAIATTLPVTARSGQLGQTATSRSLVGGSAVMNLARISNTNQLNLDIINVSGTYPSTASATPTTPATWATGDYFIIQMTYEAA